MQRQLLGLIVAVLLGTGTAATAQQKFAAPDEAASALAAAIKANDAKSLLAILGPDGEDIISSGDPAADAEKRKEFTEAYDAKHHTDVEGEKAVLNVGANDFPLPIPLMRKDGMWSFDTAAGREEILVRRIGRNELDAVQACLAYVDAQNEYADRDRGEGAGVYAQRFVSSPGKKDGLFWRDDSDPSPLGPLAAEASKEGYRAGDVGPAPYHGYYFHILKGQGRDAPGGTLNYVVKGKMIGGFGLIAWPAEYGNSGVMTFLVNHAGTVYQKDLGKRTEFIAERTTLFDPDETWKKVDAAKP
jgi:Protein of unknown function (DUF2950)